MNENGEGFRDRGVLVIGGTSGIGRATVLALARHGARICFAGLGAQDGRAVADEARGCGAATAEFIELDVRREADMRALLESAAERLGRIEIAVNNAGVETRLAPVHEFSEQEFYRVIDTNLKGVWLGLKYQIPHMLAHGGGAIVNTSSTAGVTGIANIALYTATKHAIVGLTKAAALELAQSNIRVNAVAPGPVRTGLLSRMVEGKVPLDAIAAQVPMTRISEPEEIAAAILWLASDAASYVTGHTLVADGGLTAA